MFCFSKKTSDHVMWQVFFRPGDSLKFLRNLIKVKVNIFNYILFLLKAVLFLFIFF